MMLKRTIPLVGGIVLAFVVTSSYFIFGTSDHIRSENILDTNQTVINQQIVYPDGTAKITSTIITIPPNTQTGWHLHEALLYGYILSGELTVDYGEKGTQVFKTGDALVEAMNWPHNGNNAGDVDAKILVVFFSSDQVENTVIVEK